MIINLYGWIKDELCKGLPRDIIDRVIVDDMNKRIGDYGDE